MKHHVWRTLFRVTASNNTGVISPIKLFGFIFIGVAAWSIAADESSTPAPDVEIHGPNVRPGYPDAFALGYEIAEDSISPDGKYGVIYADAHPIVDRDVGCNFLVALKPFRLLALTEAYNYYNRKALNVEWTKDSSAALVDVEGKWGAVRVHVVRAA
jgi:hypothetical protein